MADGHFSGMLKNFVYEDFIIEESMGPIADRSREFLGSSDAVIVRARRLFFKALDEHAASGKLPFGLDQGIDYRAIRALAIRYPARCRLAAARSQKSAGLRIPPVRRELNARPKKTGRDRQHGRAPSLSPTSLYQLASARAASLSAPVFALPRARGEKLITAAVPRMAEAVSKCAIVR